MNFSLLFYFFSIRLNIFTRIFLTFAAFISIFISIIFTLIILILIIQLSLILHITINPLNKAHFRTFCLLLSFLNFLIMTSNTLLLLKKSQLHLKEFIFLPNLIHCVILSNNLAIQYLNLININCRNSHILSFFE